MDPAPGSFRRSAPIGLRAAELEADRVSSFVETTSAQGRGASPTTMTATMRCQLRPTLKAGASGVAQLGQVTQSVDVGVHLRISQLATNVRVAGPQTIDGVATTEYAGSYRADEILKALPARERAKFAPLLKMMGSGPVHFREWIDGQHRLRKLVEVSTSNGTTTTGTETYTAYNQPVHITVPPASQTDTVFGF